MNKQKPSPLLAKLGALALQHPITLFLVMTFGLVYPLMALPILAQYGVIPGAELQVQFGIDLERAASALIIVPGLLLATLLVTALQGGRPAVRALLRRAFTWRIGLTWWLVIVTALPATTVALALLMGDTLRMPSVSVVASEIGQVAVAFFVINLWEETAWTGFLQTRLERRHSFFVAAVLTAIPFGAIHMPLQIINGNTTFAGLAQAFMLYLILGLIFRPLVGMALRGSGDSVLAAALMHTVFNRSNNIDGIAADLLIGPNRPLAALIATVLLTAIVGVAIRRKLTRAYRAKLDALASEAPVTVTVLTHQKPI